MIVFNTALNVPILYPCLHGGCHTVPVCTGHGFVLQPQRNVTPIILWSYALIIGHMVTFFVETTGRCSTPAKTCQSKRDPPAEAVILTLVLSYIDLRPSAMRMNQSSPAQ